MKKRILIISALFYPEITPRAFRATELAKEFKRQGHEVVVLIPFKQYSYIDFEKEYAITVKDIGKLKFREIIIQNNIVGRFLTRALRKLLLVIFEYPNIELTYKIYNALKKESGYDLIISNAWPHPVHWGVALARKKSDSIAKTWVADCGDPYFKDKNSGYKRLFYFKYVEKWFCRKANFITIPRIEMRNNYFEEFHDKIKEIPQGFNFDEVNTFKGPIENQVPTFAFAGIFIPKVRDPKQICDFLVKLELNFKFIIYTKEITLLKPYIEKLKDKIVINDFVPRNQLIFELSKMDFLINISYDPVNQSPSKLIDYSLTGRPILNIENELDEEVFREFLKGNYTKKFTIDDINKYDIKEVGRQFLSLH